MAVTNILNGTIEEISQDRNNTLVTVAYKERFNNRGEEKRVRMVVGPRTVVVSKDGVAVSSSELREGMKINAIISNAQTRSIPPQSEAFFIEIVKEAEMDKNYNTTIGRIVDVDQNNRNFTTISEGNFASIIRFNVGENVKVLDRRGRNIGFSGLRPGMRVEVKYADFMTASIPPQTTAFEVKIL